MNFNLVSGDALSTRGELLVVPLFDADLKTPSAPLTGLETPLRKLLFNAAAQEGFKARADQSFLFHSHGKLRAARVMLVGLGARTRFNPEVLRLALGRAAKTAVRIKARDLVVALPITRELDACLQATSEAFELGAYRFDRYRTSGKEEKRAELETLRVVLPSGTKKEKSHGEALAFGQRLAQAVNFARSLVNEPGSEVNPARLADEAQRLADEVGLTATIGGREEIERERMGMFLAVAKGSAFEPKLIHLAYTPKDAAHAQRPMVALVGKAITFDSGGLSLKTADGMVDMKTDMAGSAAVLGAMRIIAELAPPFPVHAFIGACENMPSGTAYRPGDVLVSRKGKTVEVTNTDAEGRLVLGDVLTWASEHKPAALIDLATLTGACVVALGNYIVGTFGEDDQLVFGVLEAGRAAGEELWRLPIHELQKDALKSEIADMKNAGERAAGSINAAHFLREFVGDVPWVHLDIAGPSQSPKERGYYGKGATGVGVRTLVEFIRRRSNDPELGGVETAPETHEPAPVEEKSEPAAGRIGAKPGGKSAAKKSAVKEPEATRPAKESSGGAKRGGKKGAKETPAATASPKHGAAATLAAARGAEAKRGGKSSATATPTVGSKRGAAATPSAARGGKKAPTVTAAATVGGKRGAAATPAKSLGAAVKRAATAKVAATLASGVKGRKAGAPGAARSAKSTPGGSKARGNQPRGKR